MIKLGKLAISIFIIYSIWFKEAYLSVGLILYGTVILATVLAFITIAYNGWKFPKLKFVYGLILFGVYSALAGFIIAPDQNWLKSILTLYFAFSIVCFDCYYFTYISGSAAWLINTIKIATVLCAIQTIFFGVEYRTEVIVRTMSVNNNPNTLGMIMLLGIFVFICTKKDVDKGLFRTGLVLVVFLITIALSGCRKALFSGVLLAAIWIFFVMKDREFSRNKKILMGIALICMGIFGVYYFKGYFIDSALYSRLLMLDNGVNTRTQLYQRAIEYWKTSPIIGIGFGQFQILSPDRLYSHSSYVEILSCTGIAGAVLFFVPLIKYFVSFVKNVRFSSDFDKYEYLVAFAMMIIELVIGFGEIYIYSFVHLILLTIVIMSLDIIPIRLENKYDCKGEHV